MQRETVTARPLGPAVAELGESPFWSAAENCVWWVDVTGRQVLRTDADTGETARWPTPGEIGFIARVDGRLVAGMERGLYGFDPASGGFDLVSGTELAAGDEEDRLVRAIRDGGQDTVDQAGQQIVQRQLQVAPTLTIRPGFPVRILVGRDLVFESIGGRQ